jgi:DNA-binding transcriptional ArsR family regulator
LLREAGLVSERKRGRERVYALERTRIRDVFGSWVAAFDAMWQENLEALKRELEEDTP